MKYNGEAVLSIPVLLLPGISFPFCQYKVVLPACDEYTKIVVRARCELGRRPVFLSYSSAERKIIYENGRELAEFHFRHYIC